MLKFFRQFAVGPRRLSLWPDWRQFTIGYRVVVTCHPCLPICTANSDKTDFLLLGDWVDPHEPKRDNADILRRLSAFADSFADVESYLFGLGGRFALITRIGSDIRLYPDAFASRAIFTTGSSFDEVWAAGAPGLIAEEIGIPKNNDRLEEFFSQPYGTQPPGPMTPYKPVRLVWCNHWLDLRTGEVVRYYPDRKLPLTDLNSAIECMLKVVSGVLRGLAERYRLIIGLSGGFDSRVLLAASESFHRELEFITLVSHSTPPHDVRIPISLAKRFGLQHHVVEVHNAPSYFLEMLDASCSGMVWGDSGRTAYALRKVFGDQAMICSGNGGETLRCYLWPRGPHPSDYLTPEVLCNKTEFAGNQVAETYYRIWLESIQDLFGYRLLDLCHWEQHSGVWLGWNQITQEICGHSAFPFANRRLLEVVLGLEPAVLRQHPYPLFQNVCLVASHRFLFERLNYVAPINWGLLRKAWDKVVRKTYGFWATRQ